MWPVVRATLPVVSHRPCSPRRRRGPAAAPQRPSVRLPPLPTAPWRRATRPQDEACHSYRRTTAAAPCSRAASHASPCLPRAARSLPVGRCDPAPARGVRLGARHSNPHCEQMASGKPCWLRRAPDYVRQASSWLQGSQASSLSPVDWSARVDQSAGFGSVPIPRCLPKCSPLFARVH